MQGDSLQAAPPLFVLVLVRLFRGLCKIRQNVNTFVVVLVPDDDVIPHDGRAAELQRSG